jgi:peptidoglycan/xylan/chitin deacetylase (PgdA/CDA1 family)
MITSPKISFFDRAARLVANASAGATARASFTCPGITVLDPAGWFVIAVYPEVITSGDVFSVLLFDGATSPAGLYNNSPSLTAGVWTYVVIEGSTFSPAIVSSSPQTMTRVQITSASGGSSYVFGGIWYVPKARPKVVISFDDEWDTQYTEAFPYMQSRGLTGSIYVIAAQVGQAGYCTTSQLSEIYRSGWDLGVHGDFQHTGGTLSNNLALITADISSNQAYLTANGFTRASLHYAYPGGSVGSNSLPALTSLGFLTSRLTLRDPVVTVPLGIANPLRLTARPISSQTGLAALKGDVDQAIRIGATVNLYGHKIVNSIVDSTTEILSSDFRSLIDYIVTKQAAGLVDVVTISDWWLGLTGP